MGKKKTGKKKAQEKKDTEPEMKAVELDAAQNKLLLGQMGQLADAQQMAQAQMQKLQETILAMGGEGSELRVDPDGTICIVRPQPRPKG
jgi:hypothetical protein